MSFTDNNLWKIRGMDEQNMEGMKDNLRVFTGFLTVLIFTFTRFLDNLFRVLIYSQCDCQLKYSNFLSTF